MATWPERPGRYLIFDGRDQYVGYWAPELPGGPKRGTVYWTGFVPNRLEIEISHWMPLPALPVADATPERP